MVIVGYGFVRKTLEMIPAKIVKFDQDEWRYVPTPVLAVDKALIVAVCTVFTLVLWPLYLYRDLQKLELLLDPDLKAGMYVDAKTSTIHYLFS
jgi:hypothetical protein